MVDKKTCGCTKNHICPTGVELKHEAGLALERWCAFKNEDTRRKYQDAQSQYDNHRYPFGR
jgi:hypothetical protein